MTVTSRSTTSAHGGEQNAVVQQLATSAIRPENEIVLVGLGEPSHHGAQRAGA